LITDSRKEIGKTIGKPQAEPLKRYLITEDIRKVYSIAWGAEKILKPLERGGIHALLNPQS
jgi:hypothetical protein